MYQKIKKLIYAIEMNGVFSSIRKGFMLIIPILITGAAALLIRSFPVSQFQELIRTVWGGSLLGLLDFIYNVTYGYMSLYLALSISYCYARSQDEGFPTLLAIITAMASYIVSITGLGGLTESAYFGPIGIFTAILVPILAVKLFHWLCGKLFPSLRRPENSVTNFAGAVMAILPFVICLAVFTAFNILLRTVFHAENLNELISNLLAGIFSSLGNTFGSGLLFILIQNLLWMFGIHGGNVLEQTAQNIFVPANSLPDAVVSKTFLDNFAYMGGSGTALCLLIALLLFSKSQNNRKLAASSAPAVLFNINEILIFGLPVVLNPVMLIPFICAPILSMSIAYGATAAGLIPVVTQTVEWTTPVLFSGYICTGTIWGSVVQAVSVAAGVFLYMPFVKLADKLQREKQDVVIKEMERRLKRAETSSQPCRFLGRGDELGVMAGMIAGRLRDDIAGRRIPMFYQPQVDARGRVFGAEALLRWGIEENKSLYPPLVLQIAREEGLINELSSAVVETASRDLRAFLDALPESLYISANITAEQLGDRNFLLGVVEVSQSSRCGEHLCLEVTEESALAMYDNVGDNIELLRSHGISMAIDDFGMGHTSLKYLQDNPFSFVKLDGSIVRQLDENPRCMEIAASVINLGKSLNFQVVAECVSSREVEGKLKNLGCKYMQGFLYSPALPKEEFLDFVRDNWREHPDVPVLTDN